MPGTPDLGTGTIFTFTGLTVNLTSVTMSGISREAVETTHLNTGVARSFIPGDLYNPGTIECEFQVDTTTPVTTQTLDDASSAGFMRTGSAAWTLAVGAIGTWAGNGFITDFSQTFPTEELATGSFTLNCTGAITTSNT